MAKELKLKVRKFWGLIPMFVDEIKELLIASATEAKHRGQLTISQRQAIIEININNWNQISNNILFLNKRLFVFQKKNTLLCSLCNKEEETPLHIFSECTYLIYLWQQLETFFEKNWFYQHLHHRLPCLGSGVTTQITMNPL